MVISFGFDLFLISNVNIKIAWDLEENWFAFVGANTLLLLPISISSYIYKDYFKCYENNFIWIIKYEKWDLSK